MLRRALVGVNALAVLLLFAVSSMAQEGFKAVPEGTPVGEQLPAGPFIVGSYAFFLLAMVIYLWTIWRRINRVEKDMQDLARRQKDMAR